MRVNKTHNPMARPLGCNGCYGPSGCNLHRKHGQPSCDKCKASEAHYRREKRRGGLKTRPLKPCGTNAAARRHRLNNEPIDFACLVAEANYRAELRAKAKEPTCANHPANSNASATKSASNAVTA